MNELLKSRRQKDWETEYFWNTNMELIEKTRLEKEKREADRKAAEIKTFQYMKCPMCAHDLKYEVINGVACVRCEDCNGIFFNSDNLEQYVEKVKPKGFFSCLANILN